MKNKYYSSLTNSYKLHSNQEKAFSMKKYLLNQFDFYGLTMPQRRALDNHFLQNNVFPRGTALDTIVRELWDLPQREYQYFALELLEKNMKQADKKLILLLETLITNKSWWDTVDTIATKLVAGFFVKYPEQIPCFIKKWIESDNMWLQRTAILFQLKYKGKTDYDLLFSCIKKCAGSKEFFIRKAIGWALREYAKTSPEKVIEFVNSNSLSLLSQREALRRIIAKKA